MGNPKKQKSSFTEIYIEMRNSKSKEFILKFGITKVQRFFLKHEITALQTKV